MIGRVKSFCLRKHFSLVCFCHTGNLSRPVTAVGNYKLAPGVVVSEALWFAEMLLHFESHCIFSELPSILFPFWVGFSRLLGGNPCHWHNRRNRIVRLTLVSSARIRSETKQS